MKSKKWARRRGKRMRNPQCKAMTDTIVAEAVALIWGPRSVPRMLDATVRELRMAAVLKVDREMLSFLDCTP